MKKHKKRITLENTFVDFQPMTTAKQALDTIGEYVGWDVVSQYVAQQGLVATIYIRLSAGDFETEIQRAIQNELENMRDSAFFGIDVASKDGDRTEYLDANP